MNVRHSAVSIITPKRLSINSPMKAPVVRPTLVKSANDAEAFAPPVCICNSIRHDFAPRVNGRLRRVMINLRHIGCRKQAEGISAVQAASLDCADLRRAVGVRLV